MANHKIQRVYLWFLYFIFWNLFFAFWFFIWFLVSGFWNFYLLIPEFAIRFTDCVMQLKISKIPSPLIKNLTLDEKD
jgi:hypothetical protein